MARVHIAISSLILLVILAVCDGKKEKETGSVPCPEDGSVGCIECKCDDVGFNSCKPMKTCPEVASSMADVKPKKDDACPYGPNFNAECTLCECTGESDHCALCFALPVRRPNQPEDVNKKLPWLQDNRFFNYEVNGWMKSVEA